jgi:hypothetical protein
MREQVKNQVRMLGSGFLCFIPMHSACDEGVRSTWWSQSRIQHRTEEPMFSGKEYSEGLEGFATSTVIKKRSRPIKAVVVCARC